MSITEPLKLDLDSQMNPKLKHYLEIRGFISSFEQVVPPLTSYFNAKTELQKSKRKFKNSNSETRKKEFNDEVVEIRDKLNRQRRALAQTKYLLEDTIYQGFGTKQMLRQVLTEMRKRYHFTNEQLKKFNSVIDSYVEYIHEVRSYFKNDCKSDFNLVFEKIFGEQLSSYPDVQPKTGPYGFEFFADEKTINHFYGANSNKKFRNVGGFASVYYDRSHGPNFEILYNFNPSGIHKNQVLTHERQHNLFQIFYGEIFKPNQVRTQENLVDNLRNLINNPDQQKNIYSDYFRRIRDNGLYRVADEYLAMIKGGGGSEYFNLFLDMNSKNAYDYYFEWRKKNGKVSLSKDDEFFYFTDSEYEKMKNNFITFRDKNKDNNPILFYIDVEDLPKVIPAEDLRSYYPYEIKDRPKKFRHNLKIINEVKTEVFETEYQKLITEINTGLIDFLDTFPQLREQIVNELSLVEFKDWKSRIRELHNYYKKLYESTNLSP